MSRVPIRDLRNNTADVVARAQAGEPIVITNRGVPAARLEAIAPERRDYLTKAELVSMPLADAGLRADLERFDELTDELETDEPGPIE